MSDFVDDHAGEEPEEEQGEEEQGEEEQAAGGGGSGDEDGLPSDEAEASEGSDDDDSDDSSEEGEDEVGAAQRRSVLGALHGTGPGLHVGHAPAAAAVQRCRQLGACSIAGECGGKHAWETLPVETLTCPLCPWLPWAG